MAAVRKKLVIVGDEACGKTCLLMAFQDKGLPEVYVPTVFENYVTDVEADGKEVELHLWDTAGQDDYNKLRPLAYPDADVILLCFCSETPESLDRVKTEWIPEVRHFCPKVPVLLIATKTDLPHERYHLVRGRLIAQRIGAWCYLECSAKTREGMREVLENAARAALGAKKIGKMTYNLRMTFNV